MTQEDLNMLVRPYIGTWVIQNQTFAVRLFNEGIILDLYGTTRIILLLKINNTISTVTSRENIY